MENYQEHAVPHGFQFSILNSVCRFESFQPIAVSAAARYCGGLTGPCYRRSKFGKDRATTNATTFVMLDSMQLFQKLKTLVFEERFVIGQHASERLEERGICNVTAGCRWFGKRSSFKRAFGCAVAQDWRTTLVQE